MLIQVFRRLLLTVITLFILTLLSFSIAYFNNAPLLSHLSLLQAYPSYLWQLIHGEFGYSRVVQLPIADIIKSSLPVTFELSFLALLLAIFVGVPLGILAGTFAGQKIDKIINVFSILGISTPTFWLALVLVSFFSFHLDWLPVSGRHSIENVIPPKTGFLFIDLFLSDLPDRKALFKDLLKHSLLPVLTLAIPTMSTTISLLRLSVISVFQQNYTKMPQIRGTSKIVIIYRHVLHNAIPTIFPKLQIQLPVLMSLELAIEYIFDWYGIGYWLLYALNQYDYLLISAITIVTGVLAICALLIIEIIGTFTDPLRYKTSYALE